jgi:hypothetical protein
MKSINVSPSLLLTGAAVALGLYVVGGTVKRILPDANPVNDGSGYNPDNVVSNISEVFTGINLNQVGTNLGGWIYKAVN